MKKIWLMVVLMFVASVVIGADKIAAPVSPTTSEVKVITWDDFKAAQREAGLLDDALDYNKAIDAYQKYAKVAEGLGRPDLKAWGLNNAAYCVIKMHKLDRTVDLNKAKALLDEAIKIETATEDCKRCLTSNSDYVNDWLGKKAPAKEEVIKEKVDLNKPVKK